MLNSVSVKHLIVEKKEIEAMKEEFLAYLVQEEKDCECEMYGRTEYDEVFRYEQHGDYHVIYYGGEKHYRELRQHGDGEFYIVHRDLMWNGDDVDYYGEILSFFMNKYKAE